MDGKEKERKPRFDDCVYNCEVQCEHGGDACGRCGWNPAVAERRIEKIREARRQTNERDDL